MSFEIQEWYKNMRVGDVVLAYKGGVSVDLITNVLTTIELKLEDKNERTKIRRKVYNILVESLQNLYHHIDNTPELDDESKDSKFAIFVFSKVNNASYKLSTGNFVSSSQMKFLKDRLDQINYLSKEQLKSIYKLILSNEEFSDKGGGGLGMIDIARKSGNKLEYKFHSFNNNYYFFCLDVIIS